MINLDRAPGEVKKRSAGFFIWAGVLVALGTGNLIFGSHKLGQYSKITATRDVRPSPGPFVTTNKMQIEKEHARVESRQALYELVTTGGEILIGFGLVVLLGTLLFQKRLDVTEKF